MHAVVLIHTLFCNNAVVLPHAMLLPLCLETVSLDTALGAFNAPHHTNSINANAS